MEKSDLVKGIVGGVVAGFSIGVGFLIAQKTVGKMFHAKKDDVNIKDEIKNGVVEGLKQIQTEKKAQAYESANGSRGAEAKRRVGHPYMR